MAEPVEHPSAAQAGRPSGVPRPASPTLPSFPLGGTLHRQAWHALGHLPTAGGAPFWADLQILRRPLAFTRAVHEQLGPVARTVIGGQPHVLLLSAGALETVLLDRERVFSAKGGWASLMGELFPRGLLLRDGDEHRHHRRLLLPSMKREALQGYLHRMVAPVQATVAQWVQAGSLPDLGLPAMRHLALSRAADLLLALNDSTEVQRAERDFSVLVEASTALLRLPIIGRRYARGLRARDRLVAQLMSLTRRRRVQPGPDLLSQLIQARDEDGHQLQDDEVVDHLVFLMMAAHDTTASALTSALVLLAQHPQWQECLRDEVRREDPTQDLMPRLAARTAMGQVIREVLRLHPPVAFFQRQALADVQVEGVRLPRGALLTLAPVHVQRDAHWWAEPDQFRPARFDGASPPSSPSPSPSPSPSASPSASPSPSPSPTSTAAAASRAAPTPHPYAWTPFGGGAHLCLGLHLADVQMRLVLGELLQRARWHLPEGATPTWRHAPITHPIDRVPLLIARC